MKEGLGYEGWVTSGSTNYCAMEEVKKGELTWEVFSTVPSDTIARLFHHSVDINHWAPVTLTWCTHVFASTLVTSSHHRLS